MQPGPGGFGPERARGDAGGAQGQRVALGEVGRADQDHLSRRLQRLRTSPPLATRWCCTPLRYRSGRTGGRTGPNGGMRWRSPSCPPLRRRPASCHSTRPLRHMPHPRRSSQPRRLTQPLRRSSPPRHLTQPLRRSSPPRLHLPPPHRPPRLPSPAYYRTSRSTTSSPRTAPSPWARARCPSTRPPSRHTRWTPRLGHPRAPRTPPPRRRASRRSSTRGRSRGPRGTGCRRRRRASARGQRCCRRGAPPARLRRVNSDSTAPQA